jgi:hypothetical protein
MYLKGSPKGNVSFYTSLNKQQNEILTKEGGFISLIVQYTWKVPLGHISRHV